MRRSIQQIAELAYKLLAKIPITSYPIKLDEVTNFLNIKVVSRDLGEEVSGMLVFKEDGPVIGVNSNEYILRRRFTIAHEIGHYVLGHHNNGLFVENSPFYRNKASSTGEVTQEVEANAFAAALLMPEHLLRPAYLKATENGKINHRDEDAFELVIKDLARDFQVSKLAMSIRLGNLMLFENF